MRVRTLGIVGVGLIGGSIGLAARQRKVAGRVVGVGRRRESLEQAKALGAIDEPALDLVGGVSRCDLAVFCTPVDRIAAQVKQVAPHCREGTLLTDAGSTKALIVEALDGGLPDGVTFVGSHPLAGSEKRGPEHARADLFEGRVVVVTPTEETDPAAVEAVSEFWRALGARVEQLDPVTHDRALAVTSHLPHLVASALAGILPESYQVLAATGFRDTTRVAAGDPSLWAAIFRHNRDALLAALSRLEDNFAEIRHALENDNVKKIVDWLAKAKQVRDALGS
ncbi:MAG TPA: prephenate dehydrogenase [Spirillospora sp.]